MLDLGWEEGEDWKGVPDIIEYAGHHPLFRLSNCLVESFGFAFALCERGVRTDCTVGIHILAWWARWRGRTRFRFEAVETAALFY
jgi:hypothetical protein